MDLGKINRNVKRIIDQGGTDQEVEQYIKAEGATLDQVLKHKPEQGVFGQVTNALSDAGTFIQKNVLGVQDPRFKDVPSLANAKGLSFENNPATRAGSGTDKMFAQTDAQYADVLENRLRQSGRFVNRQKDSEGFDLFTYKDDQGVERQAYANKPGWDSQDLDRFLTAAVPFLAGGALTGAVTKGAPLAVSALAQAGTAGSISIGSDAIASGKGSRQGTDLLKAGITAGSAGLLEAFSPAISAGLRKIFGDNRLVTPDGQFTPQGAAKVKELGLDPEQFTPDQALAVKKDLQFSADQTEAAAQIRTDEFGIPTTKGQRTKDVEALQLEEEMRRSLLGRQSKDIMDDFDTLQKKRIEDAALTTVGRRFDPNEDATIGEAFDRMLGLTKQEPASTDLLDLGGRIRTGTQSAQGKAKLVENQLWQGVGEMRPTEQGMEMLSPLIDAKIADRVIDDTITPNAVAAINQLKDFIAGKSRQTRLLSGPRQEVVNFQAAKETSGKALTPKQIENYKANINMARSKEKALLREGMVDEANIQAGRAEQFEKILQKDALKDAPIDIDTLRRRLGNLTKAQSPEDAAATRKIYEGFKEWIEVISENGMLDETTQASASKLKSAIEFTKETRTLFAPTDKMGKASPAARVLNKISDDSLASPESIVTELFGASGSMGSPKAGTPQAIKHLMRIAKQGAKDGNEDAAKIASGLRTAYWVRLVQNKQGNMNTPGVMRNNILSALKNQKSVINQLYSKDEIAVIRRFAKSLDDATFKPPNPSGTSYANEAIRRRYSGDNAVKTLLQTQQKRELFSKNNVLMSRVYQFLAKKVPANIFGSKEGAGAALARRATSQELTKKARPSSKGLGGFIGNQSGSQEQ